MQLADPGGRYEDVLGFTNQTAILLSGMGARELLPRFKQRNVSTEILAGLTLEDLQILGADRELATRMRKELLAISQRTRRSILTPEQRLDQLSEALVNNNKHLSLMRAFLTYVRLRMRKERIDSFIEMNNNLRSSKALEMAVDATIAEIKDVRSAVQELELFLDDGRPSRSPAFYFAVLGGLGLAALVVLRKSI